MVKDHLVHYTPTPSHPQRVVMSEHPPVCMYTDNHILDLYQIIHVEIHEQNKYTS
jgi:hypothetical protein